MTPDGIKRLMLDEGLRMIVYDDSSSVPLSRTQSGGWPTIGFGRNLVGKGICFSEAKLMLTNDLGDCQMRVSKLAPFVFDSGFPVVWADVATMIQYNTGNLAGWPHLLLAMRNGNTNNAVTEIINSDVYRGKGFARYSRFSNALLYRTWRFDTVEDAAYNKMVAMG